MSTQPQPQPMTLLTVPGDKEHLQGIPYVVVPFIMKRGLMVMDHRYPQDEDYDTLPIIKMTSPETWDPRDHTDSSEVTRDVAGIPHHLSDLQEQRVADNAASVPSAPTRSNTPTSVLNIDGNDLVNISTTTQDSTESANTVMQADDDEDEEFYDTADPNEYEWHISEDFTAKVRVQNENSDEDKSYFPCYSSEKDLYGNAFHLTIDFQVMLAQGTKEHAFMRSEDVNDVLDEATFEELPGYVPGVTEVDTTAYIVKAICKFQEEHDLEELRPNFGYRPVDIIRRTLENTTQYAKAFSPFPMHRHWKAMYKWFNLKRLPETICTDTVFSGVPAAITGETCAQLYYGVTSKMMNIYGMWSKGQAENSYHDFMREEGIPTWLHRDNSGEQKSDDFKDLNQDTSCQRFLDRTIPPASEPSRNTCYDLP